MKVELRIDPGCDGMSVVINAPALTDEVKALAARLEGGGVLVGWQGGRAVPLAAEDILRCYGEEKGVKCQTPGGVYDLKERLYELEGRLDRHTFVRISHSEIISLRKITALGLSLTGTIRVTLEGGAVSYVSRRYVRKIKEALEHISGSLNGIIGQINRASDQVASGAEQVATGAQSLSQGTSEQAGSIEGLAAFVGDISGQIRGNASNAEQASEKARRVGDQMYASNRQMQRMIAAMDEISSSSREIGNIIETIESIALQTNILALNASVEAARAGVAGKGFTVIANEVRNLAGDTADASKNTSALIESSMKAVKNGAAIASETAAAMMEAVNGAVEAAETVDLISKASLKQAEVTSQITMGIDQITAVIQSNSATAEECAAASEELSDQANLLNGLVEQFRLKKR